MKILDDLADQSSFKALYSNSFLIQPAFNVCQANKIK